MDFVCAIVSLIFLIVFAIVLIANRREVALQQKVEKEKKRQQYLVRLEDSYKLYNEQIEKATVKAKKIFNIQFTSERDFIDWVQARMKIFPDKSTISLLNRYLSEN